MKLYWPMCKHIIGGKEETQWTYDSSLTVEDAKKVIRAWRDDWEYQIIQAWIDVYEGNEKVEVIQVDVATA